MTDDVVDSAEFDQTAKRRRTKVKKPKRPQVQLKIDDEERLRLERLIVGDGSDLLKNFDVPDETTDSGVDNDDERRPAWEDDDDKQFVKVYDVVKANKYTKKPPGLKAKSNYQKYLKKRFNDVYGEPSWAKLGRRKDDDDDDLAVLRTSGKTIEKPTYLAKGTLEVKKMASLNSSTRNEGPIVKTVRFHPTTSVALVSGLGCTASLFQVDGSSNNKLASIRFDKFPIRCSRFTATGNEFIVGSNAHRHFFVYDMLAGIQTKIPVHHNMGMTNMKRFEISPDGKFIAVAGKSGEVHLLSAPSKEWIRTITTNGSVETLCFNPDGRHLYVYGDLGVVTVWDVVDRRLIHRFYDEGSIKGTSIAASNCGSYLAVGSASGVVNLYDATTALSQTRPSPLKALMNLVTSASTVRFNSSSQILGVASDEIDNAVKLVHLPSMTVFSNFPGLHNQLGQIQDLDFSPNSGYLSLVNNKNTASLFRVRHYGNY